MKYTKIKIFGERNTGTNYLESLCKMNFSEATIPTNLPYFYSTLLPMVTRPLPHAIALSLVERTRDRAVGRRFPCEYGWKHACVEQNITAKLPYPEFLAIVCIVKHPVTWLLSLKKRPYAGIYSKKVIANMALADFMDIPWAPVQRENYNSIYNNTMEIWNKKVASYINLAKLRPTYIMRFEDLLSDPEYYLRDFGHFFDLTFSKPFRNKDSSTKADNGKDYEFYKQYYASEKWRIDIPDQVLQKCQRLVDQKLVDRFSYVI